MVTHVYPMILTVPNQVFKITRFEVESQKLTVKVTINESDLYLQFICI